MQRIRLEFSKDGPLRFTSTLDLARAWERVLRRAGLPPAYSQGHTPQPKINLAAALPLGFTSECEVADIWLSQPTAVDALSGRLNAVAPPGLVVRSAIEVDSREGSLQSRLYAVEYRARVAPEPGLCDRIRALLAADDLLRERRGRSYDLRPLVADLWPEEDEIIGMRLSARPSATGRPDEVLAALGLDPFASRIHRTRLLFSAESTPLGEDRGAAPAPPHD